MKAYLTLKCNQSENIFNVEKYIYNIYVIYFLNRLKNNIKTNILTVYSLKISIDYLLWLAC